MDRRSFLAAGATLAIGVTGGCTGCAQASTAKLSMEAMTNEEIAERATRSGNLDPSNSRYEFVQRVVENDSVTVEDTEPRYPENRPFVFDGGVYRLSLDIVDSDPATNYRFTLDPVDGDSSTDGDTVGDSEVRGGESVRYEELPEVDRRNFAERGLDDPDRLGYSSSMLYTNEERSESVLVPDPEYSIIVWDEDTRGRWTVDGSVATSLQTYRYDSEVVRESAAAYGAAIREEYAFELSGLSEAERDVVTRAIEGGHVVPPDESPTDAFWTLAERFGRRDEFHRDDEDRTADDRTSDDRSADDMTSDDTPVSGTYIVRYERTVYWTRVRAPARGSTTNAAG